MEGFEDIGLVETDEVEGDGGAAASWGCVDGLERKLDEGNGRMGLGDVTNVGGNCGCVEKAGGEKNGYGEFVVVAGEDELA